MSNIRRRPSSLSLLVQVLPWLSAALSSPLAAQVLQVGAGGYPSIAAAVAAAPSGAVVRVAPGRYPQHWVVQDKSLRFVADAPGVVVDLSPQVTRCELRPDDRVTFAGIEFQRSAFEPSRTLVVTGGTVSFDGCLFRAPLTVRRGSAHLRRCTSLGVSLTFGDGATTITSSTLSGIGATGAVAMLGGVLQLSGSTLDNNPLSAGPALWCLGSFTAVWIVDSQLTGADDLVGAGAPAIVGTLATRGLVQAHRSTLTGGAGAGGAAPAVQGVPNVAAGPLLGVAVTPARVARGDTIQLTMRGEPGDAMFGVLTFRVGGPVGIPGFSQPAFGLDAPLLGLAVGDAAGRGVIPVAVPDTAALRDLVVWFRGVDVARSPLQMSTVVPVVIR